MKMLDRNKSCKKKKKDNLPINQCDKTCTNIEHVVI